MFSTLDDSESGDMHKLFVYKNNKNTV